MMETKKSKGIIVLSIVLFLWTLPACLMSLAAVLSMPFGIIHIIFLISPLYFLISAIGILMRKSWARLFVLFLSSVIILVILYGVVLDVFVPLAIEQISIGPALIIIATFAIIIYYLTRPKVKEQFKPGGSNA